MVPSPLAAAVVAAPDDPAGYLVAADWLQSHGDPLGELITLMWGLEHEQSPAHFLIKKRRKDELLHQHAEDWLGGAHLEEAVWRWGFVSQARLQVEHLEPLLRSRAGRFVRELEIHGPLEDLPAVLSRVEAPALSRLALVGGRRAPSLQVASVLKLLPRLRRLAVHVPDADLTGLDLSGLQDLRLVEVQHPSVTPFLTGLASPELVHLELLVDAPLELKAQAVTRAPRLREFHIEDDLADDLARWASKTPLVRQLESLHLCGPMTDRGLDALLFEAARLNRLNIAIEGGHFSTPLRRLAHRQLPKLAFHKTRAQASWWKGRPGY
jgi:uncharacterized protein (TIGR02996 family)